MWLVAKLHSIEEIHRYTGTPWSKTISNHTTHQTLKQFLQSLHNHMSNQLSESFFMLEEPWCPGISVDLFNAVKLSYKPHVVEIIKSTLADNMDAALKIGNFLLPQLQTTIARQRRDYDLSDEFPPEFPISELTDAQRENAPVNTRQIIIQGTAALREKYGDNFRSYTDAAMRVKNVKLQWSQKQDTLLGEKMTKKQIENLKIEGRVLKQLDCLKKSGGPFTTPDEVDTYLQSSASDKDKVSRLKMEV